MSSAVGLGMPYEPASWCLEYGGGIGVRVHGVDPLIAWRPHPPRVGTAHGAGVEAEAGTVTHREDYGHGQDNNSASDICGDGDGSTHPRVCQGLLGGEQYPGAYRGRE